MSRHALFHGTVCLVMWHVCAGLGAAEDLSPGQNVYQERCAACHGEKGQGTDTYASPLLGDLSVTELANYISETMPEGSPEDCVGEDAKAVAQYIYDAFYSPIAQTRNRPAQIELSRLTVRQYRHAVADLIASFGKPAEWDDKRGLQAEYYDGRQRRRNARKIERIDPVVNFDFGEMSPGEDIKAEEFAIHWEGAVIAPETGNYEFVLNSDNAVRLWINDPETPLIDARVRSGNQTEHKASTYLLGGRAYLLKLEMFKHKDKTASVRLQWIPPNGILQIIPQYCLMPRQMPQLYVCSTPFPPDDSSMGFERGTAISPEWQRATTYAALDTARYVETHLRRLVGGNDPNKLKPFCNRFVERAFRRPLTDEERKLYIDSQFEAAEHPQEAVKRVVLLALKSPRFLYLEPNRGEFDDFAVASWLSFGLWDSLPDEKLREEARQGRLRTTEQVTQQATRMVADQRARVKLREFLHTWLNVHQLHELSKDPEKYAGFGPELATDLRASLDLFLDDLLAAPNSDFRQLLLADEVYMNRRLAEYYNAQLSNEAGTFERVKWEPEKRAGVLSHPLLLAGLSYRDASSPIHRGVMLTRNVLGRMLKPPPVAVAPLAVDLHPNLTTRERVIKQTGSAECMLCHKTINDLGFALEHFDAVGRFRDKEYDKPINAQGSYTTRDGRSTQFNGVKELAAYLAGSEEVHAAFAERLFRYATKQSVQAIGDDFLSEMCDNFRNENFDIKKLAVYAVADSAMRMRELDKARQHAAR